MKYIKLFEDFNDEDDDIVPPTISEEEDDDIVPPTISEEEEEY